MYKVPLVVMNKVQNIFIQSLNINLSIIKIGKNSVFKKINKNWLYCCM